MSTDSFVPLSSAPTDPAGGDFRVLIAERPERAQPFRSRESTLPALLVPTTPPKAGCQPRISVQRDGERVSAIHIECSCGQVLDLACVYQEGVKTAPALT